MVPVLCGSAGSRQQEVCRESGVSLGPNVRERGKAVWVCDPERCPAAAYTRYNGVPRARPGTAWRTVLWVVSHVRGRPWVVSEG